MRVVVTFILLLFLMSPERTVSAIEVERFEKLNTGDGLSQSTVLSSFCDSHGFLWFGTMDGLNRFDGYSFKVYRKTPKDPFSLSNNRIVRIWEDSNHFIWVESHDGHYHCLDVTTNKFYSFPIPMDLSNKRNVRNTSFCETRGREIWLGTDFSGVYKLWQNENGIYDYQHFGSKGMNTISNEKVSFIIPDEEDNVWIGTENGVNLVRNTGKNKKPEFQHFLIDHAFSSAVGMNGKVWFGTKNKGLVSYDLELKWFDTAKILPGNIQVTTLKKMNSGNLAIGTQNSGLFIYNPAIDQMVHFFKNLTIKRIFEDRQGVLWIVTDKRGISRLNLHNSIEQHFQLASKKLDPLILDERQVFFEDAEGNIWIGSTGGGLALYDQKQSVLKFFKNDPENSYSLSSNTVYTITQDKSGIIWVGTGLPNGGINKLIRTNPLFRQLQLKRKFDNLSENLVRAVFQDTNNNVWVGTKSGQIYIYNEAFELISEFTHLDTIQAGLPVSNLYSIIQDNEGYIWVGSKGGGIGVSHLPLKECKKYDDIKFYSYKHNPADSTSLSSDLVYSIIQDNNRIIWIGTYGGGINRVQSRTPKDLRCTHFNTENSNLSSNEIRQIYRDKKNRIWFATIFGLNVLDKNASADSSKFITFTHNNSDPKSLSYNDVVHIYEDSGQRLWFGTFGGGIDYLDDPENYFSGFNHLTVENGLINDVVFGITGDNLGNIWFSTQNGISKYIPEKNNFINFDNVNGLVCSEFNENSCATLSSGNLVFGNSFGLLIINPKEVVHKQFSPPLYITKFFLFNKEVNLNDKDSPLSKNIIFTDRIVLKHNQSSFSFEYAALSYFDPKKNHYSYTLENFDNTWYDLKNERKATFTNVPPGEYVFKVKASNWEGTWTETPREIKIKILNPWWKTNAAYLGYLLILTTILYFLKKIYSNYHRLQTDLRVEKRVNEIKLQFFTDISHEIRTPLTLILGPLDDLKKLPNLPPAMDRPLNIMRRNGRRILRLVNHLLDFRKIQNQKMKLMVQQTDLVQFVKDICLNFKHMSEKRRISFSFPENENEQLAWFDEEKIDSVLFNIISNAFKFTEDGKSIKVCIGKKDGFHSVTVNDEGKGISGKDLPFLFKRFNSFSSANIQFPGSGIGLAYSYELIKLHNGDITVETIPGKGSRFTILLPEGKEHFSPENTLFIENKDIHSYTHAGEYDLDDLSDTVKKPRGNHTKNQKIVIVDDNPEVVDYLKSILHHSFQTFEANNGAEGLKRIYEIHPDLVVTDLMMPEMDGLIMTKKIKEDFTISHTPVIMLTAKSSMNDQIEGIETGAEAYVLKPFNSEYLLTVVTNLLKQRDTLHKKFHSESYSQEIKITDRDEEFIKKTIHLIEENCQDPDFSVNNLISKSYLGRTVFFNKIKGLTGQSPVEFIRSIKLQIAGKHLRGNRCSVAEAAYLSGFNDVKYFTACFTKEFGMNPSKYKKQSLENDTERKN